MSCNYKVSTTNYNSTWAILALISPTWDDFILIVSSKALVGVSTFCCTICSLICGNNATINHYLCCCDGIWKVSLSINALIIWSKSHIVSLGFCFISFSFVMHWDLDLDLFNSKINTVLISARVLTCPISTVVWNFINQTKALSLKVVANWAIYASWSWIYMASHTNMCCSGLCNLFPLNTDILKSSTIILIAVFLGRDWLTTIVPLPLYWFLFPLLLLLLSLV